MELCQLFNRHKSEESQEGRKPDQEGIESCMCLCCQDPSLLIPSCHFLSWPNLLSPPVLSWSLPKPAVDLPMMAVMVRCSLGNSCLYEVSRPLQWWQQPSGILGWGKTCRDGFGGKMGSSAPLLHQLYSCCRIEKPHCGATFLTQG